jgi:superinfection exclusion protein B
MNVPALPDLKKASEIAKSLVGQLDTHGPLLIGLTAAAVAAVFFGRSLSLPWQLAIRATAVFLLTYLLVLFWFLGRTLRDVKRHLRNLGREEKQLLRTFFLQDKRTAHLNILFAPSASLIAKGILTYATSTIPAFSAPVVIQPYAYLYLRKRLHLLDLKETDIGKDDYEDDSPWLTKP